MAMDDQETVVLRDTQPTGALLKQRYLLVRQLGEGGFGSVHLAQDQAMHDRPVVVKIQLHQSVEDPWFERKFSEEVRALSLIDHPGVVSAIDSGRTPEGKAFLVMQYVDGVTLRTVVTPEGMPLARAAEILKQMGHALSAAHEKGIWHRDLKPENLMLQTMPGGSERVRLIDFGIATVADLATDLTTTRVAGSVAYMAPEQRMGQPSAAADIYAMGLISYELLTGRKPFPAENAGQLEAMQRAGVRVKPSDLRPAVPAAAERLILQSLAWEPGRRPSEAREFGDRLAESLVASDVTRITGTVAKKRGGGRRLGIAAAVLAAAAGVAFYQARPQARPALPPAATVSAPRQERALESVKPGARPTVVAPAVPPFVPPVDPPIVPGEPEAEKDVWNNTRQSRNPGDLLRYLNRYPQGKHASDARKKLSSFQKKELKDSEKLFRSNNIMPDLNYWKSIQQRNDPQPYRDYLAKYPNGVFAPLARKKLNELVP